VAVALLDQHQVYGDPLQLIDLLEAILGHRFLLVRRS
jgi:hypothetical protein